MTGVRRVLFRSGTPSLSRPYELYTQLKCLLPGAKLLLKAFAERYCMPDKYNKYKGARNLDELCTVLVRTIIRRSLLFQSCGTGYGSGAHRCVSGLTSRWRVV